MIIPLAKEVSAYRFNISLNGSKPRIWRRILVPGTYTLENLHAAIQFSMGWTFSHLHEFVIGKRRYGEPHPDYGGEMLDHASVRLTGLFAKPGATFIYNYDFGDGWHHTIKVEAIEQTNEPLPVCLAGAKACPPEDCGGIYGYYNKLSIVANPTHPEHAEIKEWMGDIDPAAFDLDAINYRLGRLRSKQRAN